MDRTTIDSTPSARRTRDAKSLALLLESTGEGIYGVGRDGCCTFVNRAGAQMLGWRTDQVLGHNMHRLVHHTHADGSVYPEHDCPILNAAAECVPAPLHLAS